MNFSTCFLGAMTVMVEGASETCMSQCAPEARRFLHPLRPSKGSAAETAPVRLLLPGDAVPRAAVPRPWAPQRTHTGPSSVDPRGAPGGPVSSLHNCQEADTCALSGGIVQRSSVTCLGIPCPKEPRLIPHSSPERNRVGFPLSSPNPSPRLLCYSFIHDCDFSMGFFFFW